MSQGDKTDSLIRVLQKLLNALPLNRKIGLAILVVMMLFGAVAEVMSVGMVIPFLSLLIEPQVVLQYPLLMEFFNISEPENVLFLVAGTFGGCVLFAAAFRIFLIWKINHFTFGIGFELSKEIFSSAVNQPYESHLNRNSSEILGAVNKVQITVGNVLLPLMRAITATMVSITIIVFLILLDPEVALLSASTLGATYFFVSYGCRSSLKRNSAVIARGQSSRIKAMQEGLGGIRDIILDSSQSIFVNRFASVESELRRAQANNLLIGEAPRFVIEAIVLIGVVGLAFVLKTRDGGFESSIPLLGACALAAQKLLPLLQQIYFSWAKIAGNQEVVSDVLTLLTLRSADKVKAKLEKIKFSFSIELRQIDFRYVGQKKNTLKDIDMVIEKGSRIGIVGKTGSGKSTFLDVTMGLLRPTAGQILIDGVVLEENALRRWQAAIAHVPQHIFLSDATLAENIAWGFDVDSIDFEKIDRVIQAACLASLVDELPDRLHTFVGERGIRLSGGQRQRIGIARALYKDPEVLVLDEATSALDESTELTVMNSISALRAQVTIIIVAHRTTTLKNCDQIYEMQSGQLVNNGNYQQFLTKR